MKVGADNRSPDITVHKIKYYSGNRSRYKEGSIIGGIIGGLFSLPFIIVQLGARPTDIDRQTYNHYKNSFVVSAILISTGTSIGALIGSLFRTDTWEEIPLDRFKENFRPPDRYYPIFRFQFPLRK